MKVILEIISRDLLLRVITEAYEHWRKMDRTVETEASYSFELLSLAYIFLKRFNIYPAEIAMFREILPKQDIESLKDINSYNYHKIKMSAI